MFQGILYTAEFCIIYTRRCNKENLIFPANSPQQCKTWSLEVREEHRLSVFENKVLRRIFGLKRDEVTGGCRELHNDELHNLYYSPSIIRLMKLKR
jgi:hypothetical protein